MKLPHEAKVCEPQGFAKRAAALARPLIFTNGVFDILHRGHGIYLEEARALGPSLVVALNSDAPARRLGKGDARPVNSLEDRIAVIAALESVALVTWFDEDTPLARILECKPEVLVKGGDWPVESIVGAKEVAGWGGQRPSIALRPQPSPARLLPKNPP